MKAIKVQGLQRVQNKMRKAEKKLAGDTSLMGKIGATAQAMIQKRTLGGHDYLERKFKPYSKAYKARRIKNKRSPDVNLAWTGRMLAAIHPQILSKSRVLMTFVRVEEAQKALWNMKRRVFFKLSKMNMTTLKVRVIDPYMKAIWK